MDHHRSQYSEVNLSKINGEESKRLDQLQKSTNLFTSKQYQDVNDNATYTLSQQHQQQQQQQQQQQLLLKQRQQKRIERQEIQIKLAKHQHNFKQLQQELPPEKHSIQQQTALLQNQILQKYHQRENHQQQQQQQQHQQQQHQQQQQQHQQPPQRQSVLQRSQYTTINTQQPRQLPQPLQKSPTRNVPAALPPTSSGGYSKRKS